MLSEGNEVAVRFTVTGTHTGQFGYLAPTGKKIHILGIDLLGVEDGKLVSLWGGWNIAEMMVQLGFFPTAEGTQW
jgi:predicted ester cyclase